MTLDNPNKLGEIVPSAIALRPKIAIIEDNLMLAENIKYILTGYGYEAVGPATNYISALELIHNTKPDLVLIDIELEGEKTGIDVANYINQTLKYPFIYMTSLTDAIIIAKAKSSRPAGYLVKPVPPESLFTSIEISLSNMQTVPVPSEVFFLKFQNETLTLRLSEIVYIKSDHIYCDIFLANGHRMIRSSLSNLLANIPSASLWRIHRSFAVNFDKVNKVGPNFVEVDGTKIPIGRKYRPAFLQNFKDKLIKLRAQHTDRDDLGILPEKSK